MRTKRKYTQVEVQEALKLADEVGVKQAAAQLGISANTLSYWRGGKIKREASKPDSKDPSKQKVKEYSVKLKEANETIAELRGKLDESNQQVEVLKGALAFFAMDRKGR